MSKSKRDDYQEILRRIKEGKTSAAGHPFEQILEALNVYECLQDLVTRGKWEKRAWGPKLFKGDHWRGICIWQRGKGYYGYQKLQVLGVWIQGEILSPELIIGKKTLNYCASVYQSEAYQKLMPAGFEIYYGDPGRPAISSDEIRYAGFYQAENRLPLREEVKKLLKALSQSQ